MLTLKQAETAATRTPCLCCGALLRLKWSRTVFAVYALILSFAGIAS